MATKVLKKITLKEVCGVMKIQKLLKGLSDDAVLGPSVPLMQIIGVARRYRVKPSDLGESLQFLGQFKATNLETGEVFHSGSCYLPGAIPDMIFGALGPDGDRDVQFAFRVGAHFDAKAATKYVYDVESLIAPSENDPLSMLEKSISLEALPAPVSGDVLEVTAEVKTSKQKKVA